MRLDKRIKRIIGFSLLALAILIWAGILLSGLLAEGDSIQDESPQGETVIFSVDRTETLFNSECVGATWQMNGAAVVYLNGELVPVQSSERVCLGNSSVARLQVVWPDGAAKTYSFELEALISRGVIRFALLLSGIFFVVAWFFIEPAWMIRLQHSIASPALRRTALNTAMGVWMLVVVAFFLLQNYEALSERVLDGAQTFLDEFFTEERKPK